MEAAGLNIPNKLTVVRVFLAPVFLALLIWPFANHYLASLLVFIIASLTDWLDGWIARRRNIVTDFGKFLDPIADKLLTFSAFLGFIVNDLVWGAVWVVFIVLLREFLVASIRLLAAADGNVIAADHLGKVKTVGQMTAIILTLLFEYVISAAALDLQIVTALRYSESVLVWISAVLTLLSGANYLYQNRRYIKSGK